MLDLGYDRALVKDYTPQASVAPTPEMANSITSGVSSKNLLSGEVISTLDQQAGVLFSGKTAFDNVDAGYRLGIDSTDDLVKFFIGNTVSYINWDGTNLTVVGGVSISQLDIPDTVTANSFHVDSSGNAWWGSTDLGSAPAKVLNTGAATFTSITIGGYVQTTRGTFGGDGSDGALSVSSGTTTIDLGGLPMVTKQYSSISITGTGKVAFTNAHANGTIVIFKSGNTTITSSTVPCLDASAIGGNISTSGVNILDSDIHYGGNGTAGGNAQQVQQNGANGTGGSAGPIVTTNSVFYITTTTKLNTFRSYILACGSGSGTSAGGGTGGTGNGPGGGSGTSGRGGGVLVIECAGAWNFTTTNGISVAGQSGTNGTNGTTDNADDQGGGGGGGAGGSGGSAGMFLGIYNTLTANTGTVNVSGGNGGNGGNGGDTNGGQNSGPNTTYGGGGGGASGGGGGSLNGAGGAGANGNQNGNNGAGTNNGTGGTKGNNGVNTSSYVVKAGGGLGGAGGSGGAGTSVNLVALNTIFS